MATGALVGQSLGSYVVRSFIGQGGMGEVYLAEDTRLGRTVAIKVLPPPLRDDVERKERLEREAKALAAISHPHICHLFDVGNQDGAVFLVMEYLEGETLAARLVRGKLPLDLALTYGAEIAEALGAAHRQGVVHRDLKPGNIMLTPSGAKLVDFGLAARPRRDPPLQGGADVTLTLPGIVLGTPTYMSPEQVESRDADERSDIFAFGAVLYEMVAGRKAFEGESPAAVMVSVLEREPVAVSTREPLASPALDRLIRTCLEKNPDARWQSASDLARELRWMRDAGSDSSVRLSTVEISRRTWLRAIPATVLALGAGAAGWTIGRSWRSELINGVELSVEPADAFGTRDPGGPRPTRTALTISPDGRVIVFSGRLRNVPAPLPESRLYMRRIAETSTSPIDGTETGRGPFFSPDGKGIGFFTPTAIMKIPTDGGPPTSLFELPKRSAGLRGASWGDDKHIYFSHALPDPTIGIARIPEGGGKEPDPVTRRDVARHERHLLPHVLPGKKAILFTRIASLDWRKAQVVLHRLDTHEERVLISGASDARYVPTGHIVFMRMGTLMAAPFDLGTLELDDAHVVSLVDDVMHSVGTPNSGGETGAGQFAFSASGTLLYVKGPNGGIYPPFNSELLWVDRQGVELPVFPEWVGRGYSVPRLSPDHRTIAATLPGRVTRSMNISLFDIHRNTQDSFVSDDVENWPVVWSPDGTRLAYSSSDAGSPRMYVRDRIRRGQPVPLTDSSFVQFPSSWVVDRSGVEWLAFVEFRSDGQQIWIGSISGTRMENVRQLLAKPEVNYVFPEISPDGRLIAYVSTERDPDEGRVYVRPLHEDTPVIPISPANGEAPVWFSSGEIVYRHHPAPNVTKFSSVKITSWDPLEVSAATPLFEKKGASYISGGPVRNHDIAADGRLLVVRAKPLGEIVTHIKIVQDWSGELKARVSGR